MKYSNEIPKVVKPLMKFFKQVLAGVISIGPATGLLQNTAAKMQPELDMMEGTPAGPGNVPPAVEGLIARWDRLRDAKDTATDVVDEAKRLGRLLLTTIIGTLKPVFGSKWNTNWIPVGFTNHTLTVPTDPAEMLEQMRSFLESNPTREVPIINGLACTAAGAAKAALEVGISACRNRLIGVKTELAQLLPDDDVRWLTFGFDMPGSLSIPEVPENLVFTPGAAGSGSGFFDWDDARRADGYGMLIQDAAGNTLLEELIGSRSDYTANGLVSGTTVTASVTGHNATGYSQPTAAITCVVP